jgi:hypothetical protein
MRRHRGLGCWLLAAGCWLLAAGCWLLAAGCCRPLLRHRNFLDGIATSADHTPPGCQPQANNRESITRRPARPLATARHWPDCPADLPDQGPPDRRSRTEAPAHAEHPDTVRTHVHRANLRSRLQRSRRRRHAARTPPTARSPPPHQPRPQVGNGEHMSAVPPDPRSNPRCSRRVAVRSGRSPHHRSRPRATMGRACSRSPRLS